MLNGIVALLIVQAVVGKAQVGTPPPESEVIGKAAAAAPAPEVVGKSVAAAPAPEACIEMPEPGVNVREQAWYIDGRTLLVDGRDWVKYGLPRVLAPGEVEFRVVSVGGLFYAERGVDDPEVHYLLTDPAGCEFQPYQLES